jgi:hypothetical protein
VWGFRQEVILRGPLTDVIPPTTQFGGPARQLTTGRRMAIAKILTTCRRRRCTLPSGTLLDRVLHRIHVEAARTGG